MHGPPCTLCSSRPSHLLHVQTAGGQVVQQRPVPAHETSSTACSSRAHRRGVQRTSPAASARPQMQPASPHRAMKSSAVLRCTATSQITQVRHAAAPSAVHAELLAAFPSCSEKEKKKISASSTPTSQVSEGTQAQHVAGHPASLSSALQGAQHAAAHSASPGSGQSA